MMQGKSIAAIILGTILILAPRGNAQYSNAATETLSASSIPQTDQVQPAELARMLKSGEGRPVVFQVGSFVMFQQAHIPNAKFAGPGSQPGGLSLLKKLSAPYQKKQLIVIYCGCCPWNKCPNMGPAYKQLHELGFTNVKALYIASNFGDDWLAKGFPIQKSE